MGKSTPPVTGSANTFRILVIGPPGAGKTTFLKKLCDSLEDPEIFHSTGTKLEPARGSEHDINNQVVFKSNPRLIFHEAVGYDPASGNGLRQVAAFINRCATSQRFSQQLHAIWYCIPAELQEQPPLTTVKMFFNTIDTDKVPVIVVFTKFDTFITQVYHRLLDEEVAPRDAMRLCNVRARNMLDTEYEKPLREHEIIFPPAAFVRLGDMRMETSNCNELIDYTIQALGNDRLKESLRSAANLKSELEQAISLRRKCKHFRILVIGRANAGKTTLLKKVCDSIEDPEIFSPSGRKIDLSIVEGSVERGEHDIENQLIFKSNRQFIFHDSRGFESGSAEELQKVTDFIGRRAASRKLSEQLHAIWYCLPTDTNRPLLATDEYFFNTSAAGKVPVISIFTKFDGLLTEAVSQLVDEGYSFEEAEEGQTECAEKMLSDNFEKPLMSSNFPPADLVRMDDMRTEASNCVQLIGKTADALSDKTLRLLFLSVQQNNIDLCTRQVMRELTLLETTAKGMLRSVLAHFPHAWIDTEYEDDDLLPPAPPGQQFDSNILTCYAALKKKRAHVAKSLQQQIGRSQAVAFICICAEQTFTEASARKQAFAAAFTTALNFYLGSSLEKTVNNKISRSLYPNYSESMAAQMAELVLAHRLRIPRQQELQEPARLDNAERRSGTLSLFRRLKFH